MARTTLISTLNTPLYGMGVPVNTRKDITSTELDRQRALQSSFIDSALCRDIDLDKSICSHTDLAGTLHNVFLSYSWTGCGAVKGATSMLEPTPLCMPRSPASLCPFVMAAC